MANTDDLIRFLKVDMVSNGTLIHFCDAGTIGEKDFKQSDGTTKKNKALEMEVMIGDTMKKIIYSPNKTTVDLLKAAWGKDTVSWVGETGMVQLVEQISFGKLIMILVVKPMTNLNKAAQLQAMQDKFKSSGFTGGTQGTQPPAAANAQPAPAKAWEEEDLKNKPA